MPDGVAWGSFVVERIERNRQNEICGEMFSVYALLTSTYSSSVMSRSDLRQEFGLDLVGSAVTELCDEKSS